MFRKPSNAVSSSNASLSISNNNQENNNMVNQMFINSANVTPSMDAANKEINTVVNEISVADIFNSRRVWEAKGWGKRVDATMEEIKTWSAKGQFMKAFQEGRIRVTSDANATRKAGIAAIYSNKVQDAELGAALAIWEVMPYFADTIVRASGLREIALIDTEADHDVCVVEEVNGEGKVGYRVHYGQKVYNHLDNVYAGMRKGAVNPVQQGIDGKLNGWTDADGVKHEGYNAWVDGHNYAVMAFANGTISQADKDLWLKNVTAVDQTQDGWQNRFVQLNTVKHISYASIVNHYALAAWLFLDDQKPAFELHTFAKTEAQFEAFLSGRDSNLNYGYQNQMRKMAGIAYEAVKS